MSDAGSRLRNTISWKNVFLQYKRRTLKLRRMAMLRAGKLLSFGLLLVCLSSSAWSQGIFATLTGVVTDPSQSVVPSAKVTLRDVGSGSERQTVSNNEGYFTFASVPVGTYDLSV